MFGGPAWWCFFECWFSIGPMTDDSHHGEGEHDEGDVAVPAMPGAGLVMIEAEFILGSLKTILDSPAMTFHHYQLCHRRALGTPSGEEGQIITGDVAADQEASCPFPGKSAGLEICQFDVGPVMQTRPLVPSPDDRRRQAVLGRLCAIVAAVPLTSCGLPQEWNTRLAATPRT